MGNLLVGHPYRLGKRTLGVREGGKRRVLHILPTDSLVSVDCFSEDGRLVHVHSEGLNLTLFTQDLVERATLVEAPDLPERIFVAASAAIH